MSIHFNWFLDGQSPSALSKSIFDDKTTDNNDTEKNKKIRNVSCIFSVIFILLPVVIVTVVNCNLSPTPDSTKINKNSSTKDKISQKMIGLKPPPLAKKEKKTEINCVQPVKFAAYHSSSAKRNERQAEVHNIVFLNNTLQAKTKKLTKLEKDLERVNITYLCFIFFRSMSLKLAANWRLQKRNEK
jgi:hypothetical protein